MKKYLQKQDIRDYRIKFDWNPYSKSKDYLICISPVLKMLTDFSKSLEYLELIFNNKFQIKEATLSEMEALDRDFRNLLYPHGKTIHLKLA